MHSSAHSIRRPSLMGVAVALMALLAAASVARAQMVFDGNVLWKNNGSGTLAGQFTGTTSTGPLCTGKTPTPRSPRRTKRASRTTVCG